jgi:glycosyltransferase involved in cell wall biosynthesis
MFATFYPPFHFGGDAIFVYRLSHALADQGHEVDVFHNEDAYRALSHGPPAVGYAEHPGVRRIALRSALGMADLLAVQQAGRPISHASQLGDAFAPGRYDVVHFHNVSLMGAPELLRHAADTDAVSLLTLHDHWLVCPMHVLWRYDREACEQRTCVRCQLKGHRPPQLWRYSSLRDRGIAALDAVLAPSDFTRKKHRELGLKADARLLPHFVLPPVAAATQERPRQRPYFLFAGRLERLKGAHTLIEAFRHFRGAELLIAGDGSERASLEALASGLDHVHFLGRLPAAELGRYYAGARAALVPSLCYEVFGLSAVEAMAAGTPAVVRDLGALPELVRESGAGFVYGEEAELIPILRRLTEDDALRRDLSMRAAAAYGARWTLERHLERYHEIIANIRSHKRSRSASPAMHP